jgi:WD40 repeat protein
VLGCKFRCRNTFVSCGKDQTVALWDVTDLAVPVVRFLRGHNSQVTCISVIFNLVLSGSSDTSIRVWDFHSGASLRSIVCHNGYLQTLSVAMSGPELAVIVGDNSGHVAILRSCAPVVDNTTLAGPPTHRLPLSVEGRRGGLSASQQMAAVTPRRTVAVSPPPAPLL